MLHAFVCSQHWLALPPFEVLCMDGCSAEGARALYLTYGDAGVGLFPKVSGLFLSLSSVDATLLT